MLIMKDIIYRRFMIFIVSFFLIFIVACDSKVNLDKAPVKITLSRGGSYTGKLVWDPKDAFQDITATQYYATIANPIQLPKKSMVVIKSDIELKHYLDTFRTKIPKVDFNKQSVIFINSPVSCDKPCKPSMITKVLIGKVVIHNKVPILYRTTYKARFTKEGYESVESEQEKDSKAVIAFIVVSNEYL